MRKVSFEELQRHNTESDLWVAINGKVYNLTDFAPEHPGGAGVVVEQAGYDGTDEFLEAHPESIMTLTLGKDGLEKCLIGELDKSTVPAKGAKKEKKQSSVEPVHQKSEIPPIQAVLNVHDLEAIAKSRMIATGKKQAWDYYSSGADDELTYNENVTAFQRIWLRPRILVDVKNVDTQATLLGSKSDFPVYLSAVAMCGMGHEDGECAWMQAANEAEVPFMIPNLSSKSLDTILETKTAKQDAWFQIYVNPDKSVVLDQLKKLEAGGVKNLCITVDSAVPGKRERDLRNKIAMQLGQQQQQQAAAKGTTARKAGNYANRDPGLNWQDLEWFKQNITIPLVLKGVQTAEDAVLAAKAGVRGIILSNHGGRNLDTSRSGLEVLPEVMNALRAEGLQNSIEVYVDGGVRRGTDILKAIALGAKGVGLGKAAVYAMSAYGSDGIVKMLSVLKEELIKSMQLVGAASISDLKPEMVDAHALGNHSFIAPIPQSPYVPRSSVEPAHTTPKTATEIRAEIAKLSVLLEEVEGKRPEGILSSIQLFFSALMAGVTQPFFTMNVPTALHRSAIVLYLYVIALAMSSVAVLWGSCCFNSFHNAMNRSIPFFLAQCYVLLGGVVHVLAAAYQSRTKVSYILSNPLKNGKLSLSGTMLLVLAYTHYMILQKNTMEGEKNYYRLFSTEFANPVTLAIYLAGIFAVHMHLEAGWPKTVLKMGLKENQRKVVAEWGVLLAKVVCLLLAVGPVYLFVMRPTFAVEESV